MKEDWEQNNTESYSIVMSDPDPYCDKLIRVSRSTSRLGYDIEVGLVEDTIWLGDLDWWIDKLTAVRDIISKKNEEILG